MTMIYWTCDFNGLLYKTVRAPIDPKKIVIFKDIQFDLVRPTTENFPGGENGYCTVFIRLYGICQLEFDSFWHIEILDLRVNVPFECFREQWWIS